MPKIISMYLPQYHIVEENNKWWGEGFTDWIAVKNAKPLFEGHEQPKCPLNENYYDLLDKETMQWQVDLMERYGVYGQCFYHYYFKDGKKILEKPAENLLKWTDISMPFCFSWANESWITSWSNIKGGNAWSDLHTGESEAESDDGVLLLQEYGGPKQWEEHFLYLLPFFMDKRYIKKDEKPVFMIYKPEEIECLDSMINLWRKLAIQNGLNGIYIIGANSNPGKTLDAVLISEPQNSILRLMNTCDGFPRIINGEKVSKTILNTIMDNTSYYCGTPGYDNSPRKGINSYIIKDLSPEVFYKQMQSILSLSKKNEKDFVFINAWNEWGEGMYLEPDEQYGYAYLDSLKKAINDSDKEAIINNFEEKIVRRDYLAEQERGKKYREYWKLFDKWMNVIDQNRDIADYFRNNNYKKIAIYGLGMMGKHFINQIKQTEIIIDYAIDRNKNAKADVRVLGPNDELADVDVIVMCVTYDKKVIRESLEKKVNCPIIDINEVIDYTLSQ